MTIRLAIEMIFGKTLKIDHRVQNHKVDSLNLRRWFGRCSVEGSRLETLELMWHKRIRRFGQALVARSVTKACMDSYK